MENYKKQVLDLCNTYDCDLFEYAGSHYVVASKKDNDRRVWITKSHSLTEYIDTNKNQALKQILEHMKQGFNDNGSNCDDDDDCEVCTSVI